MKNDAETKTMRHAQKKCENHPYRTFTQELWFTSPGPQLVNFTGSLDAKFILGVTYLRGGCLCGGKIMCQSRKVRYGCLCGVSIRDEFRDPVDLGQRFHIPWNNLGGDPYVMQGTLIEFVKKKTIKF